MVKCGRRPFHFSVALRTIGRELCRHVVGLRHRIELVGMTGKTGVRGGHIIPIVTVRTLTGNVRMRPVQLVKIIMYVKARRHPSRGRRVAAFTVRRQAQVIVVRVRRLVKIGLVAAHALGRRVRIISINMTGRTVIGHIQVPARERVNGVVVKSRWCPFRFRMATFTVHRELGRRMVRADSRIVFVGMAAKTLGRRVRIVSIVAFRTFICDSGMCPI